MKLIDVPAPPVGRPPSGIPRQALIAAFRSGITEAISATVGFPVAVLAATDDPWRHAERLTASRHAAWLASDGASPFRLGPHRPEDASYTILRMDADQQAEPQLPASFDLVGGMLRLPLPLGVTVEDFDELLSLGLHDTRVDVLARDPEEVVRRHRSGLSANVDPRYSRGSASARRGFSLVGDLYRFRPGDLAEVAKAAALALAGASVRAELGTAGRER